LRETIGVSMIYWYKRIELLILYNIDKSQTNVNTIDAEWQLNVSMAG